MTPYLLSLAAGLLAGIIYSLLKVRSPAPPVVALVGLLGILTGEQLVPVVKTFLTKEKASVSRLDPTLSNGGAAHQVIDGPLG